MGLAAAVVLIIANLRHLIRQPTFWITLVILVLVGGPLIAIPNPISARTWKVLAGNDDSTNLRAFFAYPAAWAIASTKSLWWGVGLGQMRALNLEVLGHGIEDRLPNATSSTLAEFGIIGLFVRFGVESYFFFRMRVYRSPFRLAMFTVAFVSQLTGSYLDDVQSYLLWFFAFYPLFEDGRRSFRTGEPGGNPCDDRERPRQLTKLADAFTGEA